MLENRLDKANLAKLKSLNNQVVLDFVAEYIELCDPAGVFVRTRILPMCVIGPWNWGRRVVLP